MRTNRGSFEGYIKDMSNLSLDDANFYADLGDRMIDKAISNNVLDFDAAMKELEQTAFLYAQGNERSNYCPRHNLVSNMALCLFCSQTRANFELHQGYAKGANINQYGTPEQSENAVANLMTYFQGINRVGLTVAEPRPSSHTKWRTKEFSILGYKSVFGIDLSKEKGKNASLQGAIPSLQKGIRHLHFVTGVDKDGTVKMLIKPENWGWKGFINKFFHIIDWIKTRIKNDEVKGYDQRQETKLNKETDVKEIFSALKKDLKKIQDPSLKDLYDKISRDLEGEIKKAKGFDKPLELLGTTLARINKWMENKQPNDELDLFRGTLEIAIYNLHQKKMEKYPSIQQQKSEVRLNYNANTKSYEIPPVHQEELRQKLDELKAEARRSFKNLEDKEEREENAQSFVNRPKP
jgi:hypothetical protein